MYINILTSACNNRIHVQYYSDLLSYLNVYCTVSELLAILKQYIYNILIIFAELELILKIYEIIIWSFQCPENS